MQRGRLTKLEPPVRESPPSGSPAPTNTPVRCRFGYAPRYFVAPHGKTPRRFGEVGGPFGFQVRFWDPPGASLQKNSYASSKSIISMNSNTCFENPRVGGSIPSPATIYSPSLLGSSLYFSRLAVASL